MPHSCSGEIGDERAIPILMKVLTDRSGYDDAEVTALGRLKHKEAVPILVSRLGKPKSTFSGLDIIETEKLLEALLEIGDKRAVEPIEQYLKGDYPEQSKAVAQRVLVQLKAPDPATALLELLDKETYEPECQQHYFEPDEVPRSAHGETTRIYCPHIGIGVHATGSNSRIERRA